MTVLSACRSAGLRIKGEQPTSLFNTSDQFALELADLANEVATDVAAYYDWQALTRLGSLSGEGNQTFTLAPDFDRFLLDGKLYSSRSAWAMTQTDLATITAWQGSNFSQMTPGYWILLGGQLEVRPALITGEIIQFYYVSKIITTGGGLAFTADTDTWVLPERLLTLGLIWRWKQTKGLDYAEDMRNYELLLQQLAGKEKGKKPLSLGRGSRFGDMSIEIAYPGVLGH